MCDQQSLRLACAYAQSDQSLCLSLEYSMRVKLLTEHHLEFLSLKVGCTEGVDRGGGGTGVEGAESGVEGAESGVEGAGSGGRGGGKRV